MANNTLPPVGATVVDGAGKMHTVVTTDAGHEFWESLYGDWRIIPGDDLTRIWRLEKELAALRALAREAAVPKLGTASEVGLICADICDRLAAHAKETTT